MESCILCRLPDEVKLKIWRYLSSMDIIRIENNKVFNCNCTRNVSSERKLISKLDFVGECSLYFADLKLFVQHRPTLTTHLNINFAYWVPKGVIISAVLQMKHLKYLNALDTKLRYEHLEEIEQKKPMLKKVSVSLHSLPKYRKLNIINEVNILFYSVPQPRESINLLYCFDELQRKINGTSKCFLVDAVDKRFTKYSEGARVDSYDKSVECIIGYPHQVKWKRKSLNLCGNNIVSAPSYDNNLQNGLKSILDRFPNIEDLYIDKCCEPVVPNYGVHTFASTFSREFDNNLMLIANLSRLKSLTLDTTYVNMSGLCFASILSSCKSLQILRVRIGPYLPLLKKLYLALYLSTSLKTLCIKYSNVIDNTELISVLQKCSFKLDRLVIDVFDLRHFSEKDLNVFISSNSQLKFLYFIVKHMPQSAVKNIQKILNLHSAGDPLRIYVIRREVSLRYGKNLIPVIHYLETLSDTSTMFQSLHDLYYWLTVD